MKVIISHTPTGIDEKKCKIINYIQRAFKMTILSFYTTLRECYNRESE